MIATDKFTVTVLDYAITMENFPLILSLISIPTSSYLAGFQAAVAFQMTAESLNDQAMTANDANAIYKLIVTQVPTSTIQVAALVIKDVMSADTKTSTVKKTA